MAQPLEDPSMSPRYPSCGMLPPSLQSPFGLASALAPPSRLSHLPPPPPPAPGTCAPHPMLMLQWMRSVLGAASTSSSSQSPSSSQGGSGGPSGSQGQTSSHTPPSTGPGASVFNSPQITSEALHLAGLLSGGMRGIGGGSSLVEMVSPHPTHPPAPPMSQGQAQQSQGQMSFYSHEQVNWQNDSQVSISPTFKHMLPSYAEVYMSSEILWKYKLLIEQL